MQKHKFLKMSSFFIVLMIGLVVVGCGSKKPTIKDVTINELHTKLCDNYWLGKYEKSGFVVIRPYNFALPMTLKVAYKTPGNELIDISTFRVLKNDGTLLKLDENKIYTLSDGTKFAYKIEKQKGKDIYWYEIKPNVSRCQTFKSYYTIKRRTAKDVVLGMAALAGGVVAPTLITASAPVVVGPTEVVAKKVAPYSAASVASTQTTAAAISMSDKNQKKSTEPKLKTTQLKWEIVNKNITDPDLIDRLKLLGF
ncbi:hypothetical protein DEFDS_P242 (plasmid) [Deferribacter desulfuricans SSM1]|uniref:Lipoprotein n=1 Tax=Deferribacter desulfuricans (strain DSM 14783 / JCM 11476 / NBRC 101012 / SSM1) TaxID=639282 RepID=D3PF70_DEFDS|nr:hypothetical protein [Deferribacter desulfuricans]BAI81862.1 hypothetical protein DEFDS_P242 [Deferribacter desulfuricans SSM1]